MKILVVTQYYYPEMGAPAARYYDFAKYWTRWGNSVTILTAFPNFPDGKIEKKYRWKFRAMENIDGASVIRSYIWSRPHPGFWIKASGYFTFAISGCLNLIFQREKHDVVIATLPPPGAGIPALMLNIFSKIPLVIDIRDFWPEGLVNSGRIRNNLLIKMLGNFEKLLYHKAKLITVVTEGKKKYLQTIYPASKIEIVANGVDIEAVDAANSDDSEIKGLMAQYVNCFVYAGVMNPPQGLTVIVEAVSFLNHSISEPGKFGVIMIGDGSERERIKEEIHRKSISNIHLIGIKNKETVFNCLKNSLGIIIPLKKRKDNHTVPSKIFESMAVGRPVLLSSDGEAADIIKMAGAGLISPPEDAARLADNMISYIENHTMADIHGASGYRFARDYYGREEIAGYFLKLLEGIKNG